MKQKYQIKLLEILFSYLLPIFFVSVKYKLFTTTKASIKLTGVAIIILIFLGVKFYASICHLVKSIKNPKIRKTISVIKNTIVCVILIALLEISKSQILNLEFVTLSCGICISVGNCFKEDYVEILKQEQKDERKQEIIDAYKEATK